MDELEKAGKKRNHVSYAEADHQFHLFLGKMSKNPFLEVMMRNISKPLALQQMEVISLEEEEQARIAAESQKYHRKIFEAVKQGDKDRARKSMALHLKSVSDFMKKNL
jgi:DNA-binding FadR family transcriptional regulator